MSYDIRMVDDRGKTLEFREPHHRRGGTYVVGGTRECWLNVTYNYSKFFHDTLDPGLGIRWLYGKTGAECAPRLEEAIVELGGPKP